MGFMPKVPIPKAVAPAKPWEEFTLREFTGGLATALLISWASLEGIARKISKRQFERAQSPGRIVTILAETGRITPDDAKLLRQLIPKRNAFVHGELSTQVSIQEVERFNTILLFLVQSLRD